MKVEIDRRFGTNENEAFFAIRLYPETVAEVEQLQWGIDLFNVDEWRAIPGVDEMQHAVLFTLKSKAKEKGK